MSKIILSIAGILLSSINVQAASVNFGNNSSEYANDGECDDRRFFGDGMATDLDRDDVRSDATDCKRLYDAGLIQLWVRREAAVATKGKQFNLGDNSSEWANDGECDDIRFEGPGTANMTSVDDVSKDANDCRSALLKGRAFLRNYK